jgi:hypothetical protein
VTVHAVRTDGAVKRDVLRQMALHAIEYLRLRKLVNSDCACELGHPCEGCVIDAQHEREYREVLTAVNPPHPG